MPCLGNAEVHCCHLDGAACPHLEENTVAGRRWACGLMRRLGNWDEVIASESYRRDVAPVFDPMGMNCRDWPDGTGANRYTCQECGVNT